MAADRTAVGMECFEGVGATFPRLRSSYERGDVGRHLCSVGEVLVIEGDESFDGLVDVSRDVVQLASAACAVAPSVGVLIAARAVQGAGAATVTTLSLALVGAAFSPERRGSALGLFFAVSGLAVAGGPLVGGAITQGIDWPWIFWLNVPVGLALIPMVLSRIPESRGPNAAVDLPGLGLVAAGCSA
jgi:MFS family permease